jgi:hypothetical protein
MIRRPSRSVTVFACVVLTALVGLDPIGIGGHLSAERLPHQLTNPEFWKLVTEFSEPNGVFHSDNLVSNEARFQHVMPTLVRTTKVGRAYIGVGPEQNFTYIAALRPQVAFIVDLRRGNLNLHLMYKALFELSADRAEFVSRLFSRKRPAGLTAASSASDIFAAFAKVSASQTLYEQNLQAIERLLTATHGFGLSTGDVRGIEFVYNNMFTAGPSIHYQLIGRGGSGFPTYADLMIATDADGRSWSYLASEESFRYLKDLEARNMLLPVVGNFAGPKTLRAVGGYLRQNEMIVSAFYVSNVEQYLRQDGIWYVFCGNVNALPLDGSSTFIRSLRGGFVGQAPIVGPGFTSDLLPVASETANCRARR